MSFDLTQRAFQASQSNNISPQIVLEIDGVSTLFGAVTIKKIVKVGDFNIGDPGIFIGGQIDIEDQENIISLSSGTSTEISQNLNVDKGTNESISSMKIALVDEGLKATKLITPGEVVPDILGRRCKIWLGFAETSWRDDYIIIFRGFIDHVEAKSGVVLLNVASPDALKRSSIFPKGNTESTESMTAIQTTLNVESTSQFLAPYTGPNGMIDESLKLYLRIDDEVMRYQSNETDGYVISASNNKLDFSESPGFAPLVATLSSGTYSADDLCAEIKLQMEAVGVRTYTVTFSPATKRFTIAADSGTFRLLVLTGANVLTSVFPLIGFLGADKTGFITYDSDPINRFTNITRAQLGTLATTHDINASVESFYTIEGNAIDMALKLMLSGMNGDYVTGLLPTNFVRISPTETVANSIFFDQINLKQRYNPVVGDFITTTGDANPANNVTLKPITAVTETEFGYYLEIDDVSFVESLGTAATLSIRSQYDVYGLNAGMAMSNEEVDIDQHLDIKFKYLSSAEYLFYIKDTIEEGKEFLAEQIYNPLSAFAIPRKAQSSIGVHVGPIPGVNIKIIDNTNVIEPSKINMQRTVNKNFFNSVIYRWEDQVLEEKFTSGDVVIDGTSISQIPVGKRPLVIDAFGLRDSLSGLNQAQIAGSRRLRKYKFGAEFLQGVEVNFKTAFDVEIGDKIIVNLESLKLSDINTGTRNGEPRLFEVVNKKLKINTGRISLDLVDTNFNLDTRYALVGPASFVKTGIDNFSFIIDPSYNTTRYGTNEYKKWEKYIGSFIHVHNGDFSISGTGVLDSVVGNTITLSDDLGFTPTAGMIMEFGDYDNQTDDVKLVYGFMSDNGFNFSDGKIPYQMS